MMQTEKAYKLLALQENISNSQAKSLIDRGVVYASGRKVVIARAEMSAKTRFKVESVEKIDILFENEDIVVVDKPAFVISDEIERSFAGAKLLHRLDRETSGVLMLVKNEAFAKKAIEAFKKDKVYKEYVAWVEGHIIEDMDINKPILTEKRGNKAYSKISKKGKPARTEVFVESISGKKTKLRCVIHSGRTHQIRVHLQSEGIPIIGDEQYGGRTFKRVMLHARKVELLGFTFEAEEPKIFRHFES